MASHNTPYNPSGNSASFMVLPEQQYGFIDLQTLEDIHRYLRESTLEDDGILANWIQDNYLYEPIGESTKPIHTPEEFSQLDRAYRRVRSLTNKAQDKWPFFDRNFNKMSSSTVRNNARGEAAPGVSYSSLSETHDTQAPTNGNLITSSISPTPQLQVPFGMKQPGRNQTKQKDRSRPSQQTPVPPPTRNQPECDEQSKSSLSPNPSSADSKLPPSAPKQRNVASISEEKVVHPSTPSQEEKTSQMRAEPEVLQSRPMSEAAVNAQPNVEAKPESPPTRDAGGGKVRGPNGRYLSKVLTPSPAAEKSRRKSGGARIKYVKKSKSRDTHRVEKPGSKKARTPTRDAVHESPQPLEQDAVLDPQSPSPSAAQDEPDNVPEDRANSEQSDQAHDDAMLSNGSTPSYSLAAEADAVASNLDRLPPGLAKRVAKKRKSESEVQPDTRKRGRFGGLVGRPRKSDSQSAPSKQSAKKDIEMNPQAAGGEVAPRMETRRVTRLSAAVIDPETPNQLQKSTREGKDKEVVDSIVVNTGDATEVHEDSRKTSNSAQPDLIGIGINRTNPPKKRKRSEQPGSLVNNAEGATINNSNDAGTTVHSPGRIEYFARVHTFTGTREIPIEGDKLDKDEREVLQKYAEWIAEEGGDDIPFHQFRSIFGFVKKV